MNRNGLPGEKTVVPFLLIGLLVVLSAVLRIPNIRADTPRLLADLSGSAGEFFDEGIYCHNARNRVLFGRWITDEWNPLVYNAPLTGVYYLAFRIFGVSIVTVKGVNILFGCLGILIFYLILAPLVSRGTAAALTLLFSLDYYWLMYNRLGLLENFSALIFLLVYYLFTRSQEHDSLFFMAGMATAVAVLSKYLFAFFFFVALLAVFHHAWKRKKMKPALVFLSGFFILFLAWLILIYFPFSRSFTKIGAGWGMLALPRGLGQVFTNLRHQPFFRYLALMPLVGLCQILFFASFLSRALGRHRREIDSREVFLFLWLAGGIFTLGMLRYAPMRYYLPLVPALFLGAAFWLRQQKDIFGQGKLFWVFSLFIAVCFLPFFHNLLVSPSAFFAFPLLLRILAYTGIIAIVVLAVRPRKVFQKQIPVFLFFCTLLLSSFLYFRHFYSHPTFHLENASAYIRLLPAGSILMGQEALRLALDTRLPALEAYEGWFNDENPFQQFRPTHLLTLDKFGGAELGWMQRRFPEVIRDLKMIRRFPVWDSTVSLYRVNLPDRKPF